MSSGPLSGLLLPALCVVLAAFAGYKVGQASASHSSHPRVENITRSGNTPDKGPAGTPSKATDPVDSEDEEERLADGDLASVTTNGPCKMVLVVRTDLGMTKGKIAAQYVITLSLPAEEALNEINYACYKTIQTANPKLLRHWEVTGQAKIAVQAKSEDDILLLQAQAQSLNLVARVIQDAGRTQIQAGSRTVLGIGPGPVKLIDQVTGHLKLL